MTMIITFYKDNDHEDNHEDDHDDRSTWENLFPHETMAWPLWPQMYGSAC